MEELRQRAMDSDIVGTSESWANHGITDVELSIEEFDMFRLDRERSRAGGLIMYVSKKWKAMECTELNDNMFEESTWCKITTRDEELLIGICYRSPSSNEENNDRLLQLLEQSVTKTRHTHLMIMGDFNYPSIDFSSGTVAAGMNSASTKFFDKTQDLLLAEHVHETTRVR